MAAWNDGSLEHLIDDDVTCEVTALELFDSQGDQKLAMPYNANNPIQGYLFRRTGLLTRLYSYAIQIGIDLRFGVTVDQYWETDGSAGVYANGVKLTADCVIAADGLYSKARGTITGETPELKDIGVIAYRSIFDASEIANVPEAKWVLEHAPTADIFQTYYAEDTMVAIGTAAKGRYVHWGCAIRVCHDEPHLDITGVHVKRVVGVFRSQVGSLDATCYTRCHPEMPGELAGRKKACSCCCENSAGEVLSPISPCNAAAEELGFSRRENDRYR